MVLGVSYYLFKRYKIKRAYLNIHTWMNHLNKTLTKEDVQHILNNADKFTPSQQNFAADRLFAYKYGNGIINPTHATMFGIVNNTSD